MAYILLILVEDFLVDDVVADRLAVEDAEDIFDRDDAHAVDRLARDAGDVRGGNEARQGQERVVLRGRLLIQDVERGAGDAVRVQHVVERLLVDDAAACRVDDSKDTSLSDAGKVFVVVKSTPDPWKSPAHASNTQRLTRRVLSFLPEFATKRAGGVVEKQADFGRKVAAFRVHDVNGCGWGFVFDENGLQ